MRQQTPPPSRALDATAKGGERFICALNLRAKGAACHLIVSQPSRCLGKQAAVTVLRSHFDPPLAPAPVTPAGAFFISALARRVLS
jgi:hypothetical protein